MRDNDCMDRMSAFLFFGGNFRKINGSKAID
jgi:hypothetical protein